MTLIDQQRRKNCSLQQLGKKVTRSSRKANAPIIPFSSRGSAIDIPEEPARTTATVTVHICASLQRELPVKLTPLQTSGCRCNCRAQDKVECYGGRQGVNERHGTERKKERRRRRREDRSGRVDGEMERRQLSLSRRVSRG